MRDFEFPGRSAAYGVKGMAATSSPLATLAAIDVLRVGGNAADAAVTASAVLCVTEPAMTGIGGDCFALIAKPDGTVAGLNGSGRSARAATPAWLEASGLGEIGPDSVHAVTVPGAIDAWDKLLERYGTLTLGQALAPAIDLAEAGVPTTPRVALDWLEEADRLAGDEGGRRQYLKNGRAPRPGEIMRYLALARTLRLIAAEGRDGFYLGDIARDIVDHLTARGGLLTREDFAGHRSDWVEPIQASFAGHEFLEIPPNGQGLTALIALNILSRLGIERYGADSVERYHCEIEAMKLAWVLRNRHICDPGFAEIPVAELLSAGTADRLAAEIDASRACVDPAACVPMPGSDTIYLTVVDGRGMAVSFINSIFWGFGSGIVTPKTGIALQNRGAGFVVESGHPNCIGPGKRPLHTIIPAMVRRNGAIAMSYGVMGGAYQPMGHVAVAVNRYVYGMDPQEAIDFPRLFPERGAVFLEKGIGTATAAGLAAKGHTIEPASGPLGGGQAIAMEDGVLIGGSDPRKDGLALGF